MNNKDYKYIKDITYMDEEYRIYITCYHPHEAYAYNLKTNELCFKWWYPDYIEESEFENIVTFWRDNLKQNTIE